MLNNQPVEKVAKGDGDTLDVHSIFSTIQGEGPFSGQRAVFIRLAGCNLQCPWCDTEYTTGRKEMTLHNILAEVFRIGGKTTLVVITGGEPFRQRIIPLIELLKSSNYCIQIETNGTLSPQAAPSSGIFSTYNQKALPGRAHIVCSPKTGKVHPDIWKSACAVKYVLTHGEIDPLDGLPLRALGHVANPKLARPPDWWDLPIYVQPADYQDPTSNEMNMRACTEAVKSHGYILQLQIHKYLGVE